MFSKEEIEERISHVDSTYEGVMSNLDKQHAAILAKQAKARDNRSKELDSIQAVCSHVDSVNSTPDWHARDGAPIYTCSTCRGVVSAEK